MTARPTRPRHRGGSTDMASSGSCQASPPATPPLPQRRLNCPPCAAMALCLCYLTETDDDGRASGPGEGETLSAFGPRLRVRSVEKTKLEGEQFFWGPFSMIFCPSSRRLIVLHSATPPPSVDCPIVLQCLHCFSGSPCGIAAASQWPKPGSRMATQRRGRK